MSLKASGCGFLLGDAALFAAGLREGSKTTGSAGLLWAVGGLSTAWYANPNQEKQLALLSDDLGRFLNAQGITIPQGAGLDALMRPQGVIDHVQSFFYKHPTHLLNALGVAGGVQLLRSGIKKHFRPDIASGVLVGAAALAGLLIPEKKTDGNSPGNPIDWIREKPLRVTGALQGANNLSMFAGARQKQIAMPEQGGHLLRYTAAASYLFANAMLFSSSKESKSNVQPETLQRIQALAARVIAAQPAQTQEALLQHVAEHFAQTASAQSPAQLAEQLRAQVHMATGRSQAAVNQRV